MLFIVSSTYSNIPTTPIPPSPSKNLSPQSCLFFLEFNQSYLWEHGFHSIHRSPVGLSVSTQLKTIIGPHQESISCFPVYSLFISWRPFHVNSYTHTVFNLMSYRTFHSKTTAKVMSRITYSLEK